MQKLSAMSGIIDDVVSKFILEKAEKGADSVDRFECVTTGDQLATFSEGFVPATIPKPIQSGP